MSVYLHVRALDPLARARYVEKLQLVGLRIHMSFGNVTDSRVT